MEFDTDEERSMYEAAMLNVINAHSSIEKGNEILIDKYYATASVEFEDAINSLEEATRILSKYVVLRELKRRAEGSPIEETRRRRDREFSTPRKTGESKVFDLTGGNKK